MADNDPDDEPMLPRAELRGEKLHIDGENEPYVRASNYVIDLEVTDLRISDGFVEERSKMRPAVVTLRGRARLEGRIQFAVVGMTVDQPQPIEFFLESVLESETKLWQARVGFRAGDSKFWVHCRHCTREPFNAIVAAVRTGRVEKLHVSVETTMWTKESSYNEPDRFYLAPPIDKPSTGWENEWVTIRNIWWEESYPVRALARAGDRAPRRPLLVELPARLYSMLIAVIVIGIFIAVLLLLKQ